MRKCPSIINLTFDNQSLEAIEEIKSMHELEKHARIWLTIGNLFNIFGGSALRSTTSGGAKELFNLIPNDAIRNTAKGVAKGGSAEVSQTSYAISQANWEYYFKSYVGISAIKRKKIEELAHRQAVSHQANPKEYAFWKAIYLGCQQ
ncbi:hypothetical protein [Agarivorans gilvus]|uniref:Uncharacterized protein n=1 Tax=Agarivorans gilvus TaxID=680279 RepID=A0ABQ1I224_9ALTE|nr:hypothetical protein [Agarivorans gilvus]GGB05322.1 hypothetical protein GCM10007414_18310 [Agarivorans gilvus]